MPTPLRVKLEVIAVLLVFAIMGSTAVIVAWNMWNDNEPLPPCTCVCTNN